MKRILTLILTLTLCAALLTLPVLAAEDGPTKAEILEKRKTVIFTEGTFENQPSVSAPYAAGSLTEEFLQSGVTYLNYIRFVAGLPDVTDDDTYNLDAQHGAVVLVAVDELTHYPEKPADMEDAFFNRGYSATASSNLSYGFSADAPYTMIQDSIALCLSDSSGASNLARLGHRRWLLNPPLGKVGFGYASNPDSRRNFVVTKVLDRSGPGLDYDFISWPAAGNHPTDLFATTDAWSITLNPNKYTIPAAEDLTITITRRSDGHIWSFDSTTGTPSTHRQPYMLVDRAGCGVSNCIIFHPGSNNVDAWEGVFDVAVLGLKTKSGDATELRYSVDFFNLTDLPCEHSYKDKVTEPTCGKAGYTAHICLYCGDTYTDSPTPALGHDWSEWYYREEPTCTEQGMKFHDCARCGMGSGYGVPALGHDYTESVTAPTCTEPGFTAHTCTRCADSYEDNHTEPLGHAYTESVTEATCTEPGFIAHTCSNCGDSYEDSHTAPLGHVWAGTGCTRCPATRMTPFDDVEGGAFYEVPVAWAVEHGVTTGIDVALFGPTQTCNRAQVVTFLWRAAGSPAPVSAAQPFEDVEAGSFYEKAVLWAVENHITTGLDATHFGPNQTCNRAQVVTFLWRALNRPGTDSTRNPFADVQAGEFYYEPVLWAVEKGITNGLSANEFGINAVCNRAQIVTFLYRAFA